MAAQKVPKEAAQRGVERLAPARRATPPRPPQARHFVFACLHLPGYRCACNLRVAYISTAWKRKVHDSFIANGVINWNLREQGRTYHADETQQQRSHQNNRNGLFHGKTSFVSLACKGRLPGNRPLISAWNGTLHPWNFSRGQRRFGSQISQ